MLKLLNLTKKYNDNLVFNDFNISLPNNGLYVLKGENGSGKSTLLRILAGLDVDFDGHLILNNKEIKKESLDNYAFNEVSYLSQTNLIIEDYNLVDNILYPYYSHNKNKALNCLERVGLKDIANQKAQSISNGEKTRLSLARALFKDTKIILIDEISAFLDTKNLNIFNKILRELSKEKLIIVSTNSERDNDLIDNNLIDLNKNNEFYFDKDECIKIEHKETNYNNYFLTYKKRLTSNIVLSLFMLIFPFLILFLTITDPFIKDESIYNKCVESFMQNTNAYAIDPKYENNFDIGDQYFSTDILNGDEIVFSNSNSIGASANEIIFAKNIEKTNIELLYGKLPKEANDVLISDICFEYALNSYKKNENIQKDEIAIPSFFQNNIYRMQLCNEFVHVSGIYKSFSDTTRYKYLVENNQYFPSRILYGFGIDTIISHKDSSILKNLKGGEFTIIDKNDRTDKMIKEEYLNDYMIKGIKNMYSRYDSGNVIAPLLVVNKNGVIEKYQHFKDFYNLSYYMLIIFTLYLMVYQITYIFQERKKQVLCRALGASRKRQITSELKNYIINTLVGSLFSISIIFVCLTFFNNKFNQMQIGFPINFFGVSFNILIYLSLIILISIISFALILIYIITPKDISKPLSKLEGE